MPCADPLPPTVWTNTLGNGTEFNPANSCNNWTNDGTDPGPGLWGNASLFADQGWSAWCQGGANGCAFEAAIYCVQQ